MNNPHKGQKGIYKSPKIGELGFTVICVEGRLCWAEYDNDPGNIKPFIWTFKDGLNKLHTFI